MERLNLIKSKILSFEKLQRQLAVWRFKGQKIVFSNGCFDVIHLGHIEYLSQARDLGDVLVIGLNSDDSVRRLKGENRPINPAEARAVTLAAMSFVDAVVVFDEDTPIDLIRVIQPDVLVKGKDYDGKEIVGSDVVNARGGQVVTIEMTLGYSTTHTIELAKRTNL